MKRRGPLALLIPGTSFAATAQDADQAAPEESRTLRIEITPMSETASANTGGGYYSIIGPSGCPMGDISCKSTVVTPPRDKGGP